MYLFIFGFLIIIVGFLILFFMSDYIDFNSSIVKFLFTSYCVLSLIYSLVFFFSMIYW